MWLSRPPIRRIATLAALVASLPATSAWPTFPFLHPRELIGGLADDVATDVASNVVGVETTAGNNDAGTYAPAPTPATAPTHINLYTPAPTPAADPAEATVSVGGGNTHLSAGIGVLDGVQLGSNNLNPGFNVLCSTFTIFTAVTVTTVWTETILVSTACPTSPAKTTTSPGTGITVTVLDIELGISGLTATAEAEVAAKRRRWGMPRLPLFNWQTTGTVSGLGYTTETERTLTTASQPSSPVPLSSSVDSMSSSGTTAPLSLSAGPPTPSTPAWTSHSTGHACETNSTTVLTSTFISFDPVVTSDRAFLEQFYIDIKSAKKPFVLDLVQINYGASEYLVAEDNINSQDYVNAPEIYNTRDYINT
ncbi:hypothetical protein SPBR_08936 [Sporothrix brasiliensis 5110]|uniref:Uncharacterized protein n=1 Tax=Sporothrix brasiliensis 5110 TaxID=1398154 RepID=A0A0C2IL23_9PEZI|nr:uncharacterized protein SPBR_08936 [Sporothrix brasiliensis 5110]KIH87665.1 hypothetical protein SPBR_08936 [Sporothrix brasiliensis 5110]